jgi:septal ring factor EnvC (AmiA/AmiB activator)
MNFIKKYWTLIAIVAALLLGMFIAPRSDKDLERQFEKEREQLRDENARLNRQIKERTGQIHDIRKKMTHDSLENAKRLIASNAEIKKLKRKIHEINFQNYSVARLDSLWLSLQRADSLHQH